MGNLRLLYKNMNENDNYITILKVVKRYNVDDSGVHSNLRRGAIIGHKIGCDWLVSVTSANNFYSRKKIKAKVS